ncbi:MAG: hypothetical protein WB611_33600 [Stellaceae bacterium]
MGYDVGEKVKAAKSMPWSTAKACRCGWLSTLARSRTATGPGWCSTRYDIRRRFPWLELIWADGGYNNAWQVDAAVAKVPRLRLAIVKRSDDIKRFVVLPRCWVVERTFSWFGRNRRLSKDFENGHLRYARLHPTGPQAASQGVGRELMEVCKAW